MFVVAMVTTLPLLVCFFLYCSVCVFVTPLPLIVVTMVTYQRMFEPMFVRLFVCCLLLCLGLRMVLSHAVANDCCCHGYITAFAHIFFIL